MKKTNDQQTNPSTREYPFLVLFLILFLNFNASSQNRYISFRDSSANSQIDNSAIPGHTVVISHDIDFTYNVEGAMVSDAIVENKTYNFLHVEGYSKLTQIGAPALPVRNETVALPKGSVGQIEITNINYIEYDNFQIHPALAPAVDTDGAPSPKFVKDEAIYQSNQFYPQNVVEIVSYGNKRGTVLAFTQICPVQYNPISGKIRVYSNIEFKITATGGLSSYDYIANNNTKHFTDLLKRSVINSESIPDGLIPPAQTEVEGESNYIIITHSEYLTEAMRLANWKRQLGYTVEVVSQTSWTATEVKAAIHDRYNAWSIKPDYFVIIGDHTGLYAVPGEIKADPSDTLFFASDTYYSCMDGSSDHIPDMAHGRISVSSLAEATVVINKIINYEKTPPTNSSFYKNILNCAYYQDADNDAYADRRFCHTSEEIHDYLQNSYPYTSTRIYYRETGEGTAGVDTLRYNNGSFSDGQLLATELRDPSFNWSGDDADITTEINAGKFMVFHRDHGYVGGLGWARPYYTTSTMDNLSNGDMLPIIFSMNCHTGEFQLSNCFAEKMVRMENKGAVGVIAAAYYSYSGYNDALSLGLIDAIWSDPGLYGDFGLTSGTYTIGAGNNIYTMGDVLNQGLNAMVQNYCDSKYTYELFHYFGDPAMKIWTANPNDAIITASHSITIDCAGSVFAISNSTPYATATLVSNNVLIGSTTLDASGNGSIAYSLIVPDNVEFTISKHNCKPYTCTLAQSGTCVYPPSLTYNSPSNITTTSALLNAEITNDFEETITESGFICGTSPDPVIGGQDVLQFQTAPVTTSGTFQLTANGLQSSTTYYVKAYAINANGTGLSSLNSFTTDCGIADIPFSEDFSDATSLLCWSIADNQGNGQIWQFGAFSGPKLTGNYAYINSDAWGSGNSQNSDLISPVFDFTNYTNILVEFEHYFREYDSSSATFSYSINNGSSWTPLQSWTSSSENPASFSQDLTSELEGYSQVLFKWNYIGTWAYYWAVDDVSVTADANIPNGLAISNISYNSGTDECYGAIETITVAGNELEPVKFLSGSSLSLIAGQSITFLPGFYAHSGCDMNAYITSTASFCDALPAPIAYNTIEYKSITINDAKKQTNNELPEQTVKVFPNPNTGLFNIELNNFNEPANIKIINTLGAVVYQNTIQNGISKIELQNLNRGLYFMNIQSGQTVKTSKIIIQ